MNKLAYIKGYIEGMAKVSEQVMAVVKQSRKGPGGTEFLVSHPVYGDKWVSGDKLRSSMTSSKGYTLSKDVSDEQIRALQMAQYRAMLNNKKRPGKSSAPSFLHQHLQKNLVDKMPPKSYGQDLWQGVIDRTLLPSKRSRMGIKGEPKQKPWGAIN